MVVSGPHSAMAYPWAQPPLRRGSSPGLQRCGSGTSEFFGWAALRGIGTNPAQPAQGVGRRKLHGGNSGVRKPGSIRQHNGLTAGETALIPRATSRCPVEPAIGSRLECVAATSTRMLVTAGKDRPIQRSGTAARPPRRLGWSVGPRLRAAVGNSDPLHHHEPGPQGCARSRPTQRGGLTPSRVHHQRSGKRDECTHACPDGQSAPTHSAAGVAPGPLHHQRAGTWHELRATSARHWPMTHGRDRGAVESANSARHGGECNLPAHQKPIDLQREKLAADARFAGWVAGQPETMA